MGCDIHCYAERLEDGEWKQLTGFTEEWYDPESDYFSDERFKNSPHPMTCRNYDTFAMMANVRNGVGFAGCDTGDRIKPITMPKGLPDNVSKGIREEAEAWGYDGHSHSWLTGAEIKAYMDNPRMIVKRGYMAEAAYIEFTKTGKARNYCGGVGGYKVVSMTQEEYARKGVVARQKDPEVKIYILVEWKKKHTEAGSVLFNHALPNIIKHSKVGDGTDVRLVFWFDN